MKPDEALIRAWNLGEGKDGWSDSVIDEAESLLPILVEAGYAETEGATWKFTPKGAARAMELDGARPLKAELWRRFGDLPERSGRHSERGDWRFQVSDTVGVRHCVL
jgi:hypothetical protein